MAKNGDNPVVKSQYRIELLLEEDVLAFHYEGHHVRTDDLLRIIQYKEEFLTPVIIRRLIDISERLAGMQHPNMVPLLDYHYDGRDFFVIYKLGDPIAPLQSLLKKDPKPKVDLLWSWSMQLLAVMMECGKARLPAGISLRHLYVDREKSLRVMGIAHQLELLKTWFPELSAYEDGLSLAPEFVQRQVFGVPSDIYAYGVILYMLFSRRWPYEHTIKLSEIKRAYLKPHRPFKAAYSSVPERLEAVIDLCLQQDPTKRFADFQELIAMYHGESTPATMLAKRSKKEAAPVVKEIEKTLKNEKRRKVFSWIQIGLMVVVLGIFSLVGYQHYVNYLTGIPDVKVPPIVGMEKQEADMYLRSRKLSMIIAGERFHPTVPTGHVIETKPPVGRTVKLKRPIRVFLSKGPVQLVVPNLVGRSVDQATSMLQTHAERLEVVEESYSVDYDPGVILAQVPTPNTFLGVSENIELTVSKGFPIEVSIEEAKSFFFRKKDTFRRVLVSFSVLPEWDEQSISLFFEYKDRREKLHDRVYAPGSDKILSFELEHGGTLEVYVNDELVLQQGIEDQEEL